MSRTTLYRISLALVLAAVLAPQASWAGTNHGARPPHVTSANLFSQAWGQLVSFWGRAGSAIDPNGLTYAPTSNGGSVSLIPRTLSQ